MIPGPTPATPTGMGPGIIEDPEACSLDVGAGKVHCIWTLSNMTLTDRQADRAARQPGEAAMGAPEGQCGASSGGVGALRDRYELEGVRAAEVGEGLTTAYPGLGFLLPLKYC